MTTDPIADLLTRIRNAAHARHESCSVPASKIKENLLKLLKAEGFIANYVRVEAKPQDNLVVYLKYEGKHHTSAIQQLRRVSKPGRRVYRQASEIYPLLSGVGCTFFSTPQGILTDREAKKRKLGGEVICEVW